MLVAIFCEIDDFCKEFEKNFEKRLLTSGKNLRTKAFKLSLSEIMTITVLYHQSGYKTFKWYYEKHVLVFMKNDFKNLPSYNRFLELKEKIFLPLTLFLRLKSKNYCTGISYIDSFPLRVSHPKRILSHKTFKHIAKRGKTSTGWFYGFKLHLTINERGEIISFDITAGNVSDSNKNVIARLTKNIFGKVFGDRGYLLNKSFFEDIYKKGIHFFTKLRKNMRNKFIKMEDKYLLSKRGIIESVGSILKESLSLEHARHRSIVGFFTHILATLSMYIFREKKPSIVKGSLLA